MVVTVPVSCTKERVVSTVELDHFVNCVLLVWFFFFLVITTKYYRVFLWSWRHALKALGMAVLWCSPTCTTDYIASSADKHTFLMFIVSTLSDILSRARGNVCIIIMYL